MNLTVQAWINREFDPDSRPAARTIRQWIREGRLPATKFGRSYYISDQVHVIDAKDFDLFPRPSGP